MKSYIELLKETFLIAEVRPFFTNKNKELVKIPKIYFLDSGVANFFINNFNGLELRRDAPFLFENYVLSELIHSAAFKPRPLGRGRITPLSVSILSKPRSLDRGVEGLIKGGIEPETIKFWQDKNQTEVDFVIEAGKRLTAIEVKFKQSLASDALSAFNIFRKDYSGAMCLLVNLSCQKVFKKVKALLPYRVGHMILS